MRRFWVVLVAVVVGLVVVAPRGGADVPAGFPNDIRWLDSLLEYVAELPHQVSVYTVETNMSTTGWNDTLRFEFDARDFREVQFKFLADTLKSDSVTVFFCTGATGSWVSGNVAIFDRDPATVALQGWVLSYAAAGASVPTYGLCVPPVNIYGAHIVGPYIMGYITTSARAHRIKNLNVHAICRR